MDWQAAKRLTTRLFEIAASEPAIGRAEALQRPMLESVARSDRTFYSYPNFLGGNYRGWGRWCGVKPIVQTSCD